MSKARVGVITANYNNMQYFDEYLQGLVKQTVRPNFIVFVDDNSTNDWNLLLTKFNISDSPNIDYFDVDVNGIQFSGMKHKENKGPAAARNTAIKRLLGVTDIIFIADSDDVYYPQKIEKSLEVFKKYSYCGLVYSDYDTLNQKTGEIKREYKEIFSYKRLFEECIVSNNSAISTKALFKSGPYDETLFGCEDFDMWLRLAEMCSLYHIPEALYKYRIHGNNISITDPTKNRPQQIDRIRQKVLERNSAKTK